MIKRVFAATLLALGLLLAGSYTLALSATEAGPYDVIVTISDITPNPAYVGDQVTITAKVTSADQQGGTPTGNVEIKSGQEQVCQIVLDNVGEGKCALTFGSEGSTPLKAIYPGSAGFLPGVSETALLEVKRPQFTTLVYQNDFESAAGSEWCDQSLQTTPQGGRSFLGQFTNQTICLTLTGLPSHSQINISFDLFIIRSWNGNGTTTGNMPVSDYALRHAFHSDASGLLPGLNVVGPDEWSIEADGTTLLHTTFSNWPDQPQSYPAWFGGGNYPRFTGAEEINTLGYYFVSLPADAVYHMEFTLSHSAADLLIHFTGKGLQDLENESWGLDNVSIQTANFPYHLYLPAIIR